MAALTVTAPGWNRYRGQMSRVPPPSLGIPSAPPIREFQMDRAQALDPDRVRADALVRRLANPSSLTTADVQVAEDLLARHPEERAYRDLLEAALLATADRHHHQ